MRMRTFGGWFGLAAALLLALLNLGTAWSGVYLLVAADFAAFLLLRPLALFRPVRLWWGVR
jgi:hypothetical protein